MKFFRKEGVKDHLYDDWDADDYLMQVQKH